MAGIQEILSHHLPEIIIILANDILFYKNWKLFCRALEFEGSIMHDLQKMEPYCSTTDLVDNILAHWKSTSRNSSLQILSEKLRDIGCISAAVKVETLGTITSSKMKSDQIWFNILPPTTFYTGRNKEMLEIEKQWKNCEERKTMLFVAVTGLGGIGKSEIAKNYAKTFYEKVKGHCIWIDSETNHSLSQSFQDLAQDLRIPSKDAAGKDKSLNIVTKEIYEKISNQKCLIIFDNMESYENSTLSQIIDLASKKPPTTLKPLILTTSRFRPALNFFGDDKCIHLGLEVLSMESACELFYKSFKLDKLDSIPVSKIELIEKLCCRLQNYPLAMHQAAAYIKGTLFNNSANNLEREIQNYLQEIEIQSKRILDHKLPEGDAMGVKTTTLLTWGITMGKIEGITEIGASAVRMMDIISFLSSDNISTEFLTKVLVNLEGDFEVVESAKSQSFLQSLLKFMGRKSKSLKEEIPKPASERNCLAILRDHSMISLTEQKLSIHRLVQEVTRIQLIEKGKLTDFLYKLMCCFQKMLDAYEISGDQMIHAEKIWEYTSKDEELVTKHEEFPSCICSNFLYLGKYREAYNFSCRAVSTVERFLGESNRWTSKLKLLKGWSLQYLGEYSEALVVLTEVHKKQKEMFGEEDDNCLETANQIGLAHLRLKNPEDALKWFKPALEIRERIFGKEHQDSLVLKNNIALALDAQGKKNEAKELYQQILEVDERVNGAEHPQSLMTKYNLAIVIYKQGEYEVALKIFQEVLEVRERVLEVDHPSTLLTKDWIAYTYYCLGRKKDALHLWEEVMEKREKVLGPQHPDTLLAKSRFHNRDFSSSDSVD